MKQVNSYSKLQITALLVLRFFIGWHIVYEGITKLLSPGWSSAGFLKQSQWILSGFAHWVISNNEILSTVDFLNTWGLIVIGLGIILGLFYRTAAYTGAILLFIYFLNSPPLIGLDYSLGTDGNNLFVNKVLIEAAALLVLGLFPTSKVFGLDAFFMDTGTIRKKREKL